jgi:hypothetical protein
MANRLSAKQIGALIRLETEDDPTLLAAATTVEIYCREPRAGLIKTWTASVDGTLVTYSTLLETDLPTAGKYELQVHLAGPGWSLTGEVAIMEVHRSLT